MRAGVVAFVVATVGVGGFAPPTTTGLRLYDSNEYLEALTKANSKAPAPIEPLPPVPQITRLPQNRRVPRSHDFGVRAIPVADVAPEAGFALARLGLAAARPAAGERVAAAVATTVGDMARAARDREAARGADRVEGALHVAALGVAVSWASGGLGAVVVANGLLWPGNAVAALSREAGRALVDGLSDAYDALTAPFADGAVVELAARANGALAAIRAGLIRVADALRLAPRTADADAAPDPRY